MSKLPDFIIIGFPKCGTTATLNNLGLHPDIRIAHKEEWPQGEMYFFNEERYWQRGVDWYKGFFSGKWAGENTPSYVFNKQAMKRMRQICPEAKLIICLRDPVTRAYSHYQHRIRAYKDNLPGGINSDQYAFKETVRKDIFKIVSQGFYYQHIKRNVLPFYRRENIYILIQERMREDTDKEMNNLYNFLCAPPHHCDFERRFSAYHQQGLVMAKDTKEYLTKLYRPHNQRLFAWLGYQISEWQT